MTRFNIFRDRHEREATSGPRPHRCVKTAVDWPELRDETTVLMLQDEVRQGKPLNRTAMDEALEGLKQITPSSPIWKDWRGLQDPETCALLTAAITGEREVRPFMK